MRSIVSIKRFFLLTLGAAFAASSWVAHAESALVKETSKAASAESCVEPTAVMRRNHMDFLKHVRDETVRGGIRGSKYSLAGCIDCHASKDAAGNPVPVTDEGEFCQKCHNYVAVSPPCFQCHRTTPVKDGALGAVDLDLLKPMNASQVGIVHNLPGAGTTN